MCEPIKSINANVDKNNVILTWQAPNDDEFIRYEIYRDTKYLGETDGLSFVDSNIEHNRAFSYTYSVRPIYEDDCYGSFKSVLAQWGVNVNEYSHNANVNIYPNPANDKLYIETEMNVEEVVVYDVFGRQQTTDNGQKSIDVSNLNSGVYFVKVVTENGEVVKRFIKK